MKRLASLCFLLLLSIFVYGQPVNSRDIDSLVERTMKAFDVPGIAVAVVKDGKVIHSKGYGVRSLATMKKTDDQTLFGIASNSKAFTAAALGMLVDEGKIKWDDKVRDYIPEFKMYDPYVTEQFTIRDLLTHRSGLGLGAGDLMIFPDSNDFTLKDIINNLRYLKPVSSFRTKYDYDNNMYVIAGEVVARVSGMSWDAFIEKRIFKPLGMAHSAGSYDRLKDKTNVIDPHAAVDGKVRVIDRDDLKVGHSAGGIYSSVADLSKWVILQLNNGKYDKDKQLFSEAVHEEMWTPQTIIPVHGKSPYNTHFGAYGLGFFVSDVKGYKQLSHTGGLEGMVTQITMIPELGLGIIVLTNQQEGGAFSAITNQIKDAYLGMTGTDRVTEYAARRDNGEKEAKAITDSVWQIVEQNSSSYTKNDLVGVSRYYDSVSKKYSTVIGDIFDNKLLLNTGLGRMTFLFYAFRSPGAGRIAVNSWYNKAKNEQISVAADEFTDEQMISKGFGKKTLQYYASTRKLPNSVSVYRYFDASTHSWVVAGDNTLLAGTSVKTKKQYQYYGLLNDELVQTVPTRNVLPFFGTYKDPWLGEVTISEKNGRGWIESKRSHKLSGELLFFKANTFIARWADRSMNADAYVTFSLDEGGKASGFTMKAISPLTDFSFDFQDLSFTRE